MCFSVSSCKAPWKKAMAADSMAPVSGEKKKIPLLKDVPVGGRFSARKLMSILEVCFQSSSNRTS